MVGCLKRMVALCTGTGKDMRRKKKCERIDKDGKGCIRHPVEMKTSTAINVDDKFVY